MKFYNLFYHDTEQPKHMTTVEKSMNKAKSLRNKAFTRRRTMDTRSISNMKSKTRSKSKL